MRYTTIIDISAAPALYKSINARLVYLHICLKAGYHDNDRDLYYCSIRRLADEVGISVSACRFAVALLEKSKMLVHNKSVWRVRKWFLEPAITTRRQQAKAARTTEAQRARVAERERYNAELERQIAEAKAKAVPNPRLNKRVDTQDQEPILDRSQQLAKLQEMAKEFALKHNESK